MKISRLAERLERMPMLRLLIPFAAGIVAAGYCSLPLCFLAGAFLVSGVVALLLRTSWGAAALLMTTGLAAAQLHDSSPTVPTGVRTAYEVRIDDRPADRGRYTAAEATVVAWRDPHGGGWHAANERVLLRTDSLTTVEAGERLCCMASVRPLAGGSASYRTLMRRRGFAGSLFLTERNILSRRAERTAGLHLHAVRRLAALGVRGDAGAVVRAMTVADRSGLTPGLRTAYSRSGMSHLLAVSGLHTGLVFLLVNLLLVWLPLLRRGHLVRNGIVVAAVWLYVAATGFPASAVRAAVMCTLLQTALASSSEYSGLNTLAAAAFGMLLWNPAWIGDLSFQLSFVAVAGILVWGVPLCRRLHTSRRVLNYLTGAFSIGLAASLATAPLIAHTFGIVPLAGLLLNPVVILLASGVVLGGTCWLLLPLPLLSSPIRWIAETAAGGLNALAHAVGSLPGGVLEQSLTTRGTAACYLLFVALTAAAWCREPKKNVHLPE